MVKRKKTVMPQIIRSVMCQKCRRVIPESAFENHKKICYNNSQTVQDQQKTKLCLLCKQEICENQFREHFVKCRAVRQEAELAKIEKKTPEIKTVKKGGCGCGK
jgi:hypothetical protein